MTVAEAISPGFEGDFIADRVKRGDLEEWSLRLEGVGEGDEGKPE